MAVVAVASTNPVKLGAVRAVVAGIARAWSVRGIAVDSGVASQPWGHVETRAGARARALMALAAVPAADFGVGLEGGVVDLDEDVFTVAWCAVIDRKGRLGWGGGAMVALPPTVVAALRAGAELGPAMDRLSGLTDSKRQMGAIGLLTDGLSDRQTAYSQLVAMAFAPWRRPEWYGTGSTGHENP